MIRCHWPVISWPVATTMSPSLPPAGAGPVHPAVAVPSPTASASAHASRHILHLRPTAAWHRRAPIDTRHAAPPPPLDGQPGPAACRCRRRSRGVTPCVGLLLRVGGVEGGEEVGGGGEAEGGCREGG